MNVKAERIISIIESIGEEAYLVGGCVRDHFLGKEPKDFDITTSLEPDDVISLFKKNGYNVVPTGLQHGTVTVFESGDTEGFEITTFRIDGEYLDGRHPSDVVFTKSLAEDLSRRDLTINAMAYSPSRGIVDLFGGHDDLKNGIIRTVGNPEDRITEDALRMMRAVRFSAQLGFTISESLITAIKKHAASINLVSKERVHDELVKILMSDHPEYVEILFRTGLLKHFLPELSICFFTKQNNPWHLYDVGMHTMNALKASDKDIVLRMAILLHDIGKPICRITGEDGIDHFYGHPEVSAKKATEAFHRLKFTSKNTDDAVKLIAVHDTRVMATPHAIKRFMNKNFIDDRMFKLYTALRIADCSGQNPELALGEIQNAKDTLAVYEEIKNQPMSVKDLDINGFDIMALGFKGPQVGKVLNELLDAVITEPTLNQKDILLGMVRS